MLLTETYVTNYKRVKGRSHLCNYALLSIHIRDESRHGISDSCESLPMAVPWVDPQSRIQNGLSCAHSTDSGQIQGSLMYFEFSSRCCPMASCTGTRSRVQREVRSAMTRRLWLQTIYFAHSLSESPHGCSSTTERILVFIPNGVVEKLPTLERYRACTAKTSRNVGKRRTSSNCADVGRSVSAVQALRLPGSVWGLLAVLKLLLHKKVDLSSLMLPNAHPPVGAETLAASSHICTGMCHLLERMS